MDTTGLGAGSYPEPLESETKCYKFNFTGSARGTGYVYAKNKAEAFERINNGEYEELENDEISIEDISNVEED